MTVKTIKGVVKGITAERNAFKRELCKLSGAKVYEKAYDIHLVEEITYLICECQSDYEDEPQIIKVLIRLSAEKRFLTEFLNWTYTLDSVDVSNTEKAYEMLNAFCDCLFQEAA